MQDEEIISMKDEAEGDGDAAAADILKFCDKELINYKNDHSRIFNNWKEFPQGPFAGQVQDEEIISMKDEAEGDGDAAAANILKFCDKELNNYKNDHSRAFNKRKEFSQGPFAGQVFESSKIGRIEVCMYYLNQGQSINMESKTKDSEEKEWRAYNTKYRKFVCSGDLDRNGCLLKNKSCNFKLELTNSRRLGGWVVSDFCEHSEHCMRCMQITKVDLAAVYINKINGDKGNVLTASDVKDLFARENISTHVDADSEDDIAAKVRPSSSACQSV